MVSTVSVGGQTVGWTSLVGGRRTARMTVVSAPPPREAGVPPKPWPREEQAHPPHQPVSCSGITSPTPLPQTLFLACGGGGESSPGSCPPLVPGIQASASFSLATRGSNFFSQPSLGPGKSALSQTPWSLDPLGFSIRFNPGPFQHGTPWGSFPPRSHLSMPQLESKLSCFLLGRV